MAEVTVSGSLGATPDLSYSKEGHPWTRLAIAEKRRRKGEVGVDWWEGILWGSLAETMCGALEKGMIVTVRGKLKMEPFEREGRALIGRTVFVEQIGFSGKAL
jgi:single-stranded DNA-binding protein